jgi:hypothetical protein
MPYLDTAHISAYLAGREGQPVRDLELRALGAAPLAANTRRQELKVYGYGQPILLRYRVDGGERRAVLRTMAANSFGHEHRADRAAGLLLSYETFNTLPRHVCARDVGVLLPDGRLASLGDGGEFFLLTDYADGALYADDLQQLRDGRCLADADLQRAEHLARYLAEIHALKRDDQALYRRAARDLVGSGEGIAGLLDSYPPDFSLADAAWLKRIEQMCVDWRWRLHAHTERLSQIHGDFHPFNVLFGEHGDLWLLDRSRGGWGEPADDVACMAINYLFFSLQRSGVLASPFAELWGVFWNTYLEQTGDHELLGLAAPFLAWRALVLASPVWYDVAESVRLALFHLIEHVLAAPVFEPAQVNAYLL